MAADPRRDCQDADRRRSSCRGAVDAGCSSLRVCFSCSPLLVPYYVIPAVDTVGTSRRSRRSRADACSDSKPASFSSGASGGRIFEARAELDKRFQERIKSLPPADARQARSNLADLRQAANEISATLAEHPSDPLLQDLLMSTYQSELQLLADVSEVPRLDEDRSMKCLLVSPLRCLMALSRRARRRSRRAHRPMRAVKWNRQRRRRRAGHGWDRAEVQVERRSAEQRGTAGLPDRGARTSSK